MIRIENLDFGYSDQKILNIPELEVGESQHLMILGKSGSGKTTLLHIIGGLLNPRSGKVVFGDLDLYGLNANKLDRFRGQNIGLIFQKSHLISALTVEGNLSLTQYLSGIPKDRARIKEVLSDLGLAEKLNSKVRRLSQGEQQRVTIARALLNRPKVILADEPTASLDDDNASKVIKLLKNQANKYNATLVIATHDQRVKDEFDVQLDLNQL